MLIEKRRQAGRCFSLGKDILMAGKRKTETAPLIGKVFGGRLNIRQAPSKDAAILGRLEDDAQVKILETLTGWYRIEGGYVMAEWVKLHGGTD